MTHKLGYWVIPENIHTIARAASHPRERGVSWTGIGGENALWTSKHMRGSVQNFQRGKMAKASLDNADLVQANFSSL